MESKETYLALFSSIAAAIEFETNCLLIGDEFIPAHIRAVREDARLKPSEPPASYWQWLIGQHEQLTFEATELCAAAEVGQ